MVRPPQTRGYAITPLRQQPPGNDPVCCTPPAESLAEGSSTRQAAKLAYHARRLDYGILIGRGQDKIRVVVRPRHVLAKVLEQHFLLDAPHGADVYIFLRHKIDPEL